MKPPHAVRAIAPPTLTRRTPSAATSASVMSPAELTSRFTGLSATEATTAAMSLRMRRPGA
jgi:hypothetical protein